MAEPNTPQKVWLTDKEVGQRYSISRVTIWRKVRSGLLPKPVKMFENTTRWSVAELEAWEQSMIEEKQSA